MKGRKMMSGLSFIDPKYIQEAEFEKPKEETTAEHRRPKLGMVLLAACLVFALAGVAYAANTFGIRDVLSSTTRTLPDAAYDYIQTETASAESEDWSCAITESLSDDNSIMATVTIKGGDKYIVVPTDAMPQDSVGLIGLSGTQTLAELAQSQGKKLLFVGASITQVGGEETSGGSQMMQNISESEMVILTSTTLGDPQSGDEAICLVYAREDGSKDVQRIDLPFTPNRAPTSETHTYHPLDPNAIPCMTVGDVTVTKSALGYSVSFPQTVHDLEAYNDLMKVELSGLTTAEYSFGQNSDGTFTFDAINCQGTLSGILTITFYDCDKEYVGAIECRQFIG